MADVLLVRPADSEGYLRIFLADPIGLTQAGEAVVAELADGGTFEILLHGIREFDVPASARTLTFPDGSSHAIEPPAEG